VAVEFRRYLREDFAVNAFLDARVTLVIWRAGQSLSGRPGIVPFLLRRLYQVADFLWIKGHIGADLPPQAVAGPGIRMPHGGRGVVLHPSVRIGARAVLYHQVTIGVVDDDPAATLGDDVFLGAGAKVLGHLRIGDDVRIGANAVVLSDVPSGATAVGVPATIRPRRSNSPRR